MASFETSIAWAGVSDDWTHAVRGEFAQSNFENLLSFLERERQIEQVLPSEAETFNAFRMTPLNEVKVVILGQDPYPTPGDAHGLAFSVQPGRRVPGSLRNIFRERFNDLGIPPSRHGTLTAWAQRGVLLLNTVLTVRAGLAGSHRGKGWEKFTDAVLRVLSSNREPLAFVLWGNDAQSKKPLIDVARHVVFESAHPSPLSARRGFFGSRPFSKINSTLVEWGQSPIDWHLPGDGE
jgi:uracil-DNA glycosylase